MKKRVLGTAGLVMLSEAKHYALDSSLVLGMTEKVCSE